uniref:Uncharacterized protein n=1 Tax=Anguilla anguilla TaxID=7936 RepID=A0A0E9PP91_ANGAN
MLHLLVFHRGDRLRGDALADVLGRHLQACPHCRES